MEGCIMKRMGPSRWPRRGMQAAIECLERRELLTSFVASRPYRVAHQPTLVAVGHYSDGGVTRPFIATTNFNSGTISVFLSDSKGGYRPGRDVDLDGLESQVVSPEG